MARLGPEDGPEGKDAEKPDSKEIARKKKRLKELRKKGGPVGGALLPAERFELQVLARQEKADWKEEAQDDESKLIYEINKQAKLDIERDIEAAPPAQREMLKTGRTQSQIQADVKAKAGKPDYNVMPSNRFSPFALAPTEEDAGVWIPANYMTPDLKARMDAGEPGFAKKILPGISQYKIPIALAKGLPQTWTTKQKDDFINEGILHHVPEFTTAMSESKMFEEWNKFVAGAFDRQNLLDAGVRNRQDGLNWTPFDVFESEKVRPGSRGQKEIGGWLVDLATNERLRWVGGKTAPSLRQTETTSQLDLSSPGEMKQIVRQMMGDMLGRDATEEEFGKFKASLLSLEEKNPTRVTTTTTYAPDEGAIGSAGMGEGIGTGLKQVDRSETRVGLADADRQELLREEIYKDPEYAEYQAATTYWNIIMEMVKRGY